jgi:anti-sigma B factor antagonist
MRCPKMLLQAFSRGTDRVEQGRFRPALNTDKPCGLSPCGGSVGLQSHDQEEQNMLSLTIHKLGDTTLFRYTGRLVSGDSESLRDAVLTSAHTPSVVLDLAEVHSVDAAGLGVLLFLREWAQTTGAKFKLMNLTPRVEELLELTKLRNVFEFCSVPEMLALMCHALRQTRPIAAITAMPQPLTRRLAAPDCTTASDPAA